jgi:hypothetical protein
MSRYNYEEQKSRSLGQHADVCGREGEIKKVDERAKNEREKGFFFFGTECF